MLDDGIAFLKEHKTVALAGGVGVAGLVALTLFRKPKEVAPIPQYAGVSGASTVTNPLGGTQPGTIGGVSYVQLPGSVIDKRDPLPGQGMINLILKGSSGKYHQVPFTQVIDQTKQCPPGYALVVAHNGKTVCGPLDERTTARPGNDPNDPWVKATRSKTATGQGGEADALTNPGSSTVPMGPVNYHGTRNALRLPLVCPSGWDVLDGPQPSCGRVG